jgi:hypothetical protein
MSFIPQPGKEVDRERISGLLPFTPRIGPASSHAESSNVKHFIVIKLYRSVSLDRDNQCLTTGERD